ncbi:MAG TPA: glycine oxidase ThiO [Mariprofundaceae bacterium]|nr:glycine oxidase ThiO [Mariprofundaceae bacterium]
MNGSRQQRLRVVIVGGGIIGCLTAWYLARRGAAVTVLERGRAGMESSWAGAGILCPIHPWLYPDAFTELVEASLALYPELSAELHHLTGISTEWCRSGLLIPEFAEDRVSHREAALAWSARFEWQVESLDASALHLAEPLLSKAAEGGLLWPDVGQVRNPRLLQAVRVAMLQAGVELREGADVVGPLEENGRVCGVLLAGGGRLQAEQVLLAAGSWSGELAGQFGLKLPVEPVKGQIVLLKTMPGTVRHIIKHDDAYFVPRTDGRVLVGASMERVGFARGTTDAVVDSLLAAAYRIVPALQQAEIERQWMGFRPGSPDGLPYLGPVPGKPGLWVASGHYRNGVALAPITAELMSGWMLGEVPKMELSAFRIGRPLQASGDLGLPDKGD